MARTIVTIPTYNERENIGLLLDALLDLGVPGLEALVVDDNSPDGTAQVVEEVARKRPGVHLFLRTKDKGRGRAGAAAFVRALELGADYMFEMDADFSHQPRYIPQMLEVLQSGKADVVIGSRFCAGGRDADRPLVRRAISELARHYTRTILAIPIQDVTSGYRGFTAACMRACEPATCVSPGPAIVQELLFRAAVRHQRMHEVPIEFVDRTRGESTLTLKILLQSLVFVPRLRLRGW
jgi:dolichol-phosphate mannosyltransferase